jgi:hypothetical protein
MSISSVNRKAGPYSGNDVTVAFPFAFKVFTTADVVVVATDVAGVESILALGTNYSISLNSDQEANPGGTVTMVAVPATGTKITLTSDVAELQPVTLTNQGGFYPKVINDALDRATIQIQQLAEKLGRALVWPISAAGATLPSPEPSKFIGWNATADSLVNLDGVAVGDAQTVSFNQAGTGAVTRTAQDKMREMVSANDFGAVGDGVADDTTALTNFFNSAIANPGVPHYLLPKTYAINLALPTINVSNVIIECPGASFHDVGSVLSGAVIKWVGAAGATMQTISAVSGGSNQRLSNIVLRGVAYDCNNLAANGLVIKSVCESIFEIACIEATAYALFFDCVATLGEAADCQKNRIRFLGRQVLATGGICLGVTGTATANFSMNEIWVDVVHTNTTAIIVANADNNDWEYVRCYKAGAGTATESVSLQGGATVAQRARSERFHYFVANLPMRAYGTGTFTYGAISNKIFCLDKENGTPDPIVDAGASLYWQNDLTPFGDSPWVSFTPTITAGSGSFTSVSGNGYYLKRGKIVHVVLNVTCTTIGTAGSYVSATLPFAETNISNWIVTGKNNTTGAQVVGSVSQGTATANIANYAGSFPLASGQSVTLTGFYAIS